MTIADAPAVVAAAADAAIRWHPGASFRLDQTMFPLMRGNADPSFASHSSGFWMAFTTASGPVTVRLSGGGLGVESFVDAQAWGPGAEDAVAGMPGLLGAHDDWSAFDDPAFHATLPRLVTESRRRNLALRLPSTGRMVDSLVPTILEQKVTTLEARRGYRYLIYRYGTPAPGKAPAGLLVPPTARQWLAVPSWEWHKAGVGPQRSATVMRALQSAVALERLAELDSAQAGTKLQTIPGIGIWTAAEVVQRTHGCPDSISVGDYHLAAYVGYALTGRKTDDAGMIELLEPWRGQRQRLVRMLYLSGFRKPTFGPRMTVQDHRGH
ncbi:3-methyladenine DNA glycosylase [Arthrobacter sp. MYb23]|uniref:DNA-3-methyladenine glycosylase family protein n=1 Tax=unclassified Arthrobacter TaxID=235627 RepID=UPI000CFB600E|nr:MULTISPECIES: 3-methyladenine DNA glycosylase [unclassified Arthrobacter]PRB45138.1 3-methyladenine DNA glycosylase [Arthrobacter sp. MYb51]PRB99399.1 3-methyladenine DNA glycosylase [Arthrobacter sp. MYb23]